MVMLAGNATALVKYLLKTLQIVVFGLSRETLGKNKDKVMKCFQFAELFISSKHHSFHLLQLFLFSQWDRCQIGVENEAKHVIYQKLLIFTWEKDIHVNRLESVIFGM